MADLPGSPAKEGEEVPTSKEDTTRSFLDYVQCIQQYELFDTEDLCELYKQSELSDLEFSGLIHVLERRGVHMETLDKWISEKENKKEVVGINNKFMFAYKREESPSLKAIVLTPLIYLAAPYIISFVIVFSVGFYGLRIGVPTETIRQYTVALCHVASLLAMLLIAFFLLNMYKRYLFGSQWKCRLKSRLWVGVKWSILYIILNCIGILTPEHRAEWVRNYFLLEQLSTESATLTVVVLISTTDLIGTILEEVIFRGMIQQHVKKFVTPRKSVFMTAGIFTLAHFGNFFFVPSSLGDIVSWFLVGVFSGFAFNKHNSCISAFIPHFLLNLKYIIIVPLILTF